MPFALIARVLAVRESQIEAYLVKRDNAACQAAQEACFAADKRLHEVLAAEFPLHAAVRVYHSRGSFFATVVGWRTYSGYGYVVVRNVVSLKGSKRHFSDIELLG